MNPTITDWLRGVLAGHSTEDQTTEVIRGWDRYFQRLGIDSHLAQRTEFDSIMRIRAANGEISVVAYDPGRRGVRGEDLTP